MNYPDTVYIGTRISRIGNSSIQMDHRLVSRKLDDVAAEVTSTLVMLDYRNNKPVPVSAEARSLIGAIEGKSFDLTHAA
jgi:acyl-CoA thioester hydrolase